MGIKFAPAIKTTQHTQSDPMDPGDTAEGNGGPLLVTGDGLPSTLNKVLRSSIKEGHKCREAKEIRYTQQTLQGQTRREAKEIRLKQQTLQGPEEDHLT